VLREITRRRRLARPATITAAAVLAVSVALSTAGLAAGTGLSGGAVVKTRKASLGTILVNAQGRTLYMFMKDTRNKSACSGQCAIYWPPLTTNGKPRAAGAAKVSLLATTKRLDGHTQVSYAGHPLYRFSQDTKAGQTTGEAIDAFGGKWYAVSPAGVKVMPSGSTGGYGGGYGG
jgi:predicted lipoprotein with Yx(FWY)xxD motif